MNPVWRDWTGLAVIVPVVSLGAVWLARRIAHFFVTSMQRSFAEVVLDVMAPDMAHLSTKVSSSLDELRENNSHEHAEVQHRLGGVENRLTDVEHRLTTIEHRLDIRPLDARTRVTDKED